MAFEGLTEKLSAAFKKLRGKGRLSEADVKEAMREIRLALLEADVSYKVVKQFIAQVTEKAVGADVLEALSPAQQIIKIVNQELTDLMGGESTKLTIASKPPTVVMMVGLQARARPPTAPSWRACCASSSSAGRCSSPPPLLRRCCWWLRNRVRPALQDMSIGKATYTQRFDDKGKAIDRWKRAWTS